MNWEQADLEREFRRFKQHCEFIFEGPLNEKSEKVKCNYLMPFMGDKGREIYTTFEWIPRQEAVLNEQQQEVTAAQAAENETLNGIFTKFGNYVAPKRNQIRATVLFNRRIQKENERFDDFVTDLKRLVKNCGFGDMEQRMLRDAIVLRSLHARVREKCLDRGDDLTLEMAISYGQSFEASSNSLKVISNSTDRKMGNEEIHKTEQSRQYYPYRNKAGAQRYSYSNKEENVPTSCPHCGRKHRGECRFKKAVCHQCKQVGHIKPVCGKSLNLVDDSSNTQVTNSAENHIENEVAKLSLQWGSNIDGDEEVNFGLYMLEEPIIPLGVNPSKAI